MQRVFRMFMHPHPSGLAAHFWNIAGVDLVIGHRRDPFEPLAFRLADLAGFRSAQWS